MLSASLLIIGCGFLLLAQHPFVSYPLSLWLIARFRSLPLDRRAAAPEETFAICLCAYNEEAVIRQKAENLLMLSRRSGSPQVLIYVDAGNDRTAEILREYGDQFLLIEGVERKGKTHGMNRLVALADASVLVFTDANVMIEHEAIGNLRSYFADPQVGCVCGHLLYTNRDANVTAEIGSLYWRTEELIKRLESRTGSVMGADGSLFAMRRHLYRPAPDDIIDDLYVSLTAQFEGFRVVSAGDVRAFEESVTNPREEYRRKIRIACQGFNVHRLLWPKIRRLGPLSLYKYLSHKFLRWIAIYDLAISALFIGAGLVVAGHGEWLGWLVAAGVLTAWLGSGPGLWPFVQVVEIVMALVGTGLGVWRSIRRERFQTWTPAASIRQRAPRD